MIRNRGYIFFTIDSELNKDMFMNKLTVLFDTQYAGIDKNGIQYNVNLFNNDDGSNGRFNYKFEFIYDINNDVNNYGYDRWENMVLMDIVEIGVAFLHTDINVTKQSEYGDYSTFVLYPNDFSHAKVVENKLGRNI